MRLLSLLLAAAALNLWLTPDQQGRRLFERKDYAAAAEAFDDPLWRGVSWYRAGEFKKALAAFSQVDTPDGLFNAGNALVFLGEYEQAVKSYDAALASRPGWVAAQENRDLAAARAEALKAEGGDLGDQKLGADDIVFDKDKESGGQDTEVAGEQATSNEAVQALWLRRVQTEPADFLKAKFAYQQAMRSPEESP